MYVFICNFCVWYVYQEIIMQTATPIKTKQTHDITSDSWWSVQNQMFALLDV